MTGCGLASCGSASPGPAAEPDDQIPTVTVPADLPIIVSIAGRFSNRTLAALDEQIAGFEAENPGIRVEVVRAPRDPAQRRKWIETGLGEGDTSIDIYVLDATWPSDLAAEGELIALDQRLAAQGIRLGAFLPGTLQANSLDGHLMALPWTADSGLLFYRRDLLDRFGYGPPATWEELQRLSLEIKAGERIPNGFVWQGAADEDLTCNTLEHVWSRGIAQPNAPGGGLVDSTETREALGQMRELVDSGASPQDVAAYDRWAAQTAFRNGEAIFLRDWYAAWESLNDVESPVAGQIGLAPLPAGCLGGQSLGLSIYSLHPDKAIQFMTFLTGYDQQVQLATSAGLLPSLKAVYDDEATLATLPILEVVRAALAVAEPRPSVVGYALFSEVVYTEVHKMLAGQQDIGTTAENMKRGIDPLVR
jgi:multiple sugar transport system substrate-binding protein